ncbi:fringe glycosyltransferase [Aedes albopictus]|uniref:Fringe-like glycosyltransferase domain-containing protein n=1 Tax=Aedes albopictus TaxID=7160 RepID=A0ABM1ZN78_AEDAL
MRCLRKKMSQVFSLTHRYKRALQIMAIVTFLIYMTLVLYQNVYGYNSAGNSVQELQYNSLDPAATENVISKRDNGVVNSDVLSGGASEDDTPNGSARVAKIGANRFNRNSKPTRSDYYDSGYPNGQQSVTGTPKPPTTELDDLLISVKTTKGYHDTRLEMITKTWYQLAKEQTWFFTDTDDQHYQKLTNGHMVNTNCSQGHFRKALCCKMGKEFEFFLDSAKKYVTQHEID